ncbi:ribonuclease H-like domain-containing protein [Tanacetum coccineum]
MSLVKDKCFVKDSSELKIFSENDEVTSHKIFFDDFQTDSQASSPNDDGREPSGSNISPESESDDTAKEQSSDDDQRSVQIGEEEFSKGNAFENNDVPTNLFDTGESNTPRSTLNEDVYMFPRPEYFDKNETIVCKLKKSLYGVKQALRQWSNSFSKDLVENDFKQSRHDHSLYTKESGGSFVSLLVYIDDIVLTDINEINKVKTFLKSKFKIKDLGELKYVLGIEPVSTPLPQNIILAHKEPEDDKLLKNITNLQRLVGKLIYFTLTRPNISYSVHCLSQHMQAPLQSPMYLDLRVLKYLKGASRSGVNYEKSEHMSLKVYANFDWAKCLVTRRSVSGYFVFFNGCMVSWKSKNQAILSKSSTKAEYRSIAAATCEVMWVMNNVKDLKITNLLTAELYFDNSVAIQISANPVMHEKTKHFDVDVHIIREKVASGLIKTAKIDFENQTTDIFTKALGFP